MAVGTHDIYGGNIRYKIDFLLLGLYCCFIGLLSRGMNPLRKLLYKPINKLEKALFKRWN
jgi:hypothetical protein